MAAAQVILGVIALRQGDHDRARACLEASLAIRRELAHKRRIAGILDDLAALAGEQDDDERQAAALEESLALYREPGNKSGISPVLSDLIPRADYQLIATALREAAVAKV